MSLTVVASGTAAPTVGGAAVNLGTEQPASPTIYVLRIDTSAMAAGDTAEIYVYAQTLAGGAWTLEQFGWVDGGNNPAPSWISPPTPVDAGATFQIAQITGTARSFPWKLYSL